MSLRFDGNTFELDIEGKQVVKHRFIETLRRLDLGPIKSYNEVLQEMLKPMIGMKVEDINTGSVLLTLLEKMGDEEKRDDKDN